MMPQYQSSEMNNFMKNFKDFNENMETDSFYTDSSMKSPLKFGFGSGKKSGINQSVPNSTNSSQVRGQIFLVKRRVNENDSKYSNIVKEVQTFG